MLIILLALVTAHHLQHTLTILPVSGNISIQQWAVYTRQANSLKATAGLAGKGTRCWAWHPGFNPETCLGIWHPLQPPQAPCMRMVHMGTCRQSTQIHRHTKKTTVSILLCSRVHLCFRVHAVLVSVWNMLSVFYSFSSQPRSLTGHEPFLTVKVLRGKDQWHHRVLWRGHLITAGNHSKP